jgi:hypothetical protein
LHLISVTSKITLFDEYRIESRGNNEIYLEIGLESLSKALRSAEMAGTTGRDSEAGVKLSKKNDKAVLVFDIVGQASRSPTLRHRYRTQAADLVHHGDIIG